VKFKPKPQFGVTGLLETTATKKHSESASSAKAEISAETDPRFESGFPD